MSRPVAWITGASRGIGAALALSFGKGGYDVVLAARDADRLEGVAGSVRKLGVDALAVATDLAHRDQIERLFAAGLQRFGRVDVLINNAVLSRAADFLTMTADSWRECMAVNLDAVVFCSQLAAREMVKAKRGVIVNIGSIMEKQSAGLNTAYVSAKGAMQALTRDLAVRLGPSGVRVLTVSPGDIDTGVTDTWTEGNADPWIDHFQDMTPAARRGTPQDISEVVVFLCSETASYITGTELVIDGGRLAAMYPRSLWQSAVNRKSEGG